MNRECEICNSALYVNPSAFKAGRGRFCSKKCFGIYRRGKPVFRKTKTELEHFWGKTKKTKSCWLWTSTIMTNGYGSFEVTYKRFSRRTWLAHRFSYELHKGPISETLQIDHLCRNKICVNPEHLEAVTPRENNLRGIGPAAINSRKTSCKRGHLFAPKNTRIKNGARICRECQRIMDRYYYKKRIEECV